MTMNQRNDPGSAAKKMEDFLRTLTTVGGLDLRSNILACNGQVQPNSGGSESAPKPVLVDASSVSSGTAPNLRSGNNIDIKVEFTGADTALLLARNGELLHAIEHIAAKILRLEPEDHDRVSFDAEGFKATRDRNLELSAEAAIHQVRSTGRPYFFPPMTSRERRIIHLALTKSGLPSASSGEGPRRFVVLYPEGHRPTPAETQHSDRATDRTQAIRSTFRRR
jgi:spoIIIJ-associated protein